MVFAHKKVSAAFRSFGTQIWMFVWHVRHASNTQRPHRATHVNLWRSPLMCGNWQPSPVSQCWLLCWWVLHWLSGSWYIDASPTNGHYVNRLKKLQGHFIKLKHFTSSSSGNRCDRTKEWLVQSRMEELLDYELYTLIAGYLLTRIGPFNLLDCSVKRCSVLMLSVGPTVSAGLKSNSLTSVGIATTLC